jgi:DNA polymerase-3 subunit epsilon
MNELLTYLALDFETNGQVGADGKWDTASQRPVEVAVIRVVDNEPVAVFNTLIYYDGVWTPHLASAANHHTPEDLRKGMDEAAVTAVLWNLMLSTDTVVAYNALFDLEVFYHMMGRTSGMTAGAFQEGIEFIDPLTIARDRHPYPHKMGDMCRKYGVELAEAHRAMDDCSALVELTQAMHNERSITGYRNIAGFKAQYGEPQWLPKLATLKPQGNETVYHTPGGGVTKNRPKPFARLVPNKG